MILLLLPLGVLGVLYILQRCTVVKKSLKGKHVLITGGSSGIGRSVGILAAKLGAHVTILARDTEKLKSASEEIISTCLDKENQKVKAISLDVTDPQKVEEILKEIDRINPVFALINCAGMAICGQIEELSNEDNRKLVDLNLMGTIYCVRTLLPSLKQRQKGIIVITASQAALFGIFGLATYSATKYALRGFAEGLEMEVRAHNISVTLALPPDTDTPGFENENKNKPQETFLISESGGLYSPDEVAEQLINDALIGKFYSYIGFESFMLSTLCCGMSPFISFFEVLTQALLVGPFRLISSFYILKFQKIVKKLRQKKVTFKTD